MNTQEFLNYQIKVPLEVIEVEELAKVFLINIEVLSPLQDRDQFDPTVYDILIFQLLITKTVQKLEMDKRRNRIEGYVRKKPYNIKLTKPQIYWLYRFIENNRIHFLYSLHTNILGKHIVEMI